MTFPTVAATNQGNDTVNGTSHTINLPASISSGDLLIVAVSMDGNTSLTWPAGWTALSGPTNSGGDGTLEARYRIADGSEGATITITTAASEAQSHISWRITGWHGTTPPEAGTPATANNSSPDPPSVAPSWGSEDNLYIAVMGWGVSTSNISAYPTNYSISQMTDAASNVGIAAIAIAGRELAASSDNPGTATIGSNSTWAANTLVVRPAAGGTTYNQSASGAITPAAALTKQTSHLLTGVITPAGVLLKQASHFLTGAITPAGTLIKQAQKVLEGTLAPAGSLSKQASKVLSGGITPAAALDAVRTILASLSGALSFSGSLNKQTGKALAGSLTPTGALSKLTSRALTGVVGFAGALTKQTSKILTGAVSFAGTLAGEIISTVLHYVSVTLFMPQGEATLQLPPEEADVEG